MKDKMALYSFKLVLMLLSILENPRDGDKNNRYTPIERIQMNTGSNCCIIFKTYSTVCGTSCL